MFLEIQKKTQSQRRMQLSNMKKNKKINSKDLDNVNGGAGGYASLVNPLPFKPIVEPLPEAEVDAKEDDKN